MKKIFLLSFALITICLASCKKDHTCNCVDAEGKITEVTVINGTKSSAEDACVARKTSPESCSID